MGGNAHCWGSKLTIAQGSKKNNTLGYRVMKKEKKKKEEKDERKAQRIGIQKPMKGKGFKKYIKKKKKEGPVGQSQ